MTLRQRIYERWFENWHLKYARLHTFWEWVVLPILWFPNSHGGLGLLAWIRYCRRK